jgi:hypothetical protein
MITEAGNSFEGTDLSRIPLAQLSLIEKNRGKAGALNEFLYYYRHLANRWARSEEYTLLYAVIDARHMLVKPKVFWNYAFPYFAHFRSKKENLRSFGGNRYCILVQYPQHLIGNQDYIDNKNAAFYTLDQTLRDCANCCTSSGTNAIWDLTNPVVEFETCSRVEDTATTQNFLLDYYTIHILCFIANGVPKREQDYLDSIYRWTTGSVELFWPTLYRHFEIYLLVFVIALIYASAWGFLGFLFPPVIGYIVWILVNAALGIYGFVALSNGRKPYRSLNVAFVIVQNTMYWVSNILSPCWFLIVPGSIGNLDFSFNYRKFIFLLFPFILNSFGRRLATRCHL